MHPVQPLISLSVDAPAVTVVSMTGEMRSLATTNGRVTIELTGSPQHLQFE
jgi:hypothetical protein